MMQMQAIVSDRVPVGKSKGSGTNANGGIVGGEFHQLIDQLLGKVQAEPGAAPTTPRKRRVVENASLLGEAEAHVGLDAELVDDDQDSIEAVSAHTLGLAMLCPNLQVPDNETVDVLGEAEQAVADDSVKAIPFTGLSRLVATATDTSDLGPPAARLALTVNGDSHGAAAEPLAVQEGLVGVAPVASPSLEVKLLERLQADIPEAFALPKQYSGEVSKLGQWNQLARYCLLEKTDAPREGPEEIAGNDELAGLVEAQSEPFVQPLHERLLVATRQAPLIATEDPPIESLGNVGSEESEQTNLFATYVDASVENQPVFDTVQRPEVYYASHPGMRLDQQLAQGMASGVRQLRLLRSQEGITVRMQLHPESLGEVQVELKLVGNTLTAQMRALQPQAAEALRQELPLLRENLVNQGFTRVFLGAEMAEQFGQSPDRAWKRFQEERQRRPQRIAIVKAETEAALEAEPATQRLDYRL